MFPLADTIDLSPEEQSAFDEAVHREHTTFLSLDELEDVIANATMQKKTASVEELAAAARFYAERDAYLDFTHRPPPLIDGASVLYWAWACDKPFGRVESTDGIVVADIYGLAICQYPDGRVYRFSCCSSWETEQDAPYASVADAMERLPEQYRDVTAEWVRF